MPLQHWMKHGARQGVTYDIKLWAFKKDFYESDLCILDTALSTLRSERSQSFKAQADMIKTNPEAAQASTKLLTDMQEMEKKISHLRHTSMTIEEAQERLPEVQQHSKL